MSEEIEINDDIFNNEKIFPEPHTVFEKDSSSLDEAKEEALIVLDTNILLFPYTVSSNSLKSIQKIYEQLIAKLHPKITPKITPQRMNLHF